MMLQEPTDLELAAQIDFLQWIIGKRRDGDEFKRKMEVQLFCIRAVRDALTKLRERSSCTETPRLASAPSEQPPSPEQS